MAPKARASASPAPTKSTTSSAAATQDQLQDAVLQAWNNYVEKTPQRVKFLDVFLGFLVVVGVLQFVYCVLAGNFVRDSCPRVLIPFLHKIMQDFVAFQAIDFTNALRNSPSMPSSPASAPPSASSCLLPAFASRQTLRTRRSLRRCHRSVRLQTMFWAA